MKQTTSISKVTEDDTIIRGRKLSKIVDGSFSDAIFLLLRGKEPSAEQGRLFAAMLTISIDHGAGTASAQAARFAASAGTPVKGAIAAGVLALGKRHGGAIEDAMRLFQRNEPAESVVREALERKERLPGYGHRLHPEEDPRTVLLTKLAAGMKTPHLERANAIESEIERQKKLLCLNVDGCLAALLLDLGFLPAQGNAVFIIARTPGLAAHAIEAGGGKLLRLDESEIEYSPE